jgi:hypothetical protein
MSPRIDDMISVYFLVHIDNGYVTLTLRIRLIEEMFEGQDSLNT